MAYAEQADLEKMYGADAVASLADHDGDDAADTGVIDEALDGATAIIDGYLAVRYPVPLANPPKVVKDLCVDIAWYRLASNSLKRTTEMRQRYEDAIDYLKSVSKGVASIGLDTDDDDESDDVSTAFAAKTEWLGRA